MEQQIQNNPQETPATGGGLGDMFGDDSIFAPTVTVRHGVMSETTHGEQTVGEIRARMRDRLGINDGAEAYLNGNPVGDDVRVMPNQKLMFMRKAGEKGAALHAMIADGAIDTDNEIVVTYKIFRVGVVTDQPMAAGALRKYFNRMLNIHSDAVAVCDGMVVKEDHLISPGQHVSFIKPSGAMGP